MFSYIVQSTQPTTPTNAIVLGTVTVSGGAISASDESYRETAPPNLKRLLDYRQGLIVSTDPSDAAKIQILPGNIDLGTVTGAGVRRNTTITEATKHKSTINLLKKDK